MSEVIVITSGKGGVGKTTTVANIGTGLAMLGKKVVVVDTCLLYTSCAEEKVDCGQDFSVDFW